MNNRYGGLPEDLGPHSVKGYMEDTYVLYLPVKMNNSSIQVPDNLKMYEHLVYSAINNINRRFEYIYLSVENRYIPADTCQKRPGWHVDGYLTNDETYIYTKSSDTTEYINQSNIELGPIDDLEALHQFNTYKGGEIVHINSGHLYNLKRCIHRSPTITKGHKRLFVKISFSNDRYNLYGNSKNYLFDYDWKYVERDNERNTPSKDILHS